MLRVLGSHLSLCAFSWFDQHIAGLLKLGDSALEICKSRKFGKVKNSRLTDYRMAGNQPLSLQGFDRNIGMEHTQAELGA